MPCSSGRAPGASMRCSSRRRRTLTSAVAVALALAGATEAFALGRRALPRGAPQRGNHCRSFRLPQHATPDSKLGSDVEAAASGPSAWLAAGAALCLLAGAVALSPVPAAHAEDTVQVVSENGEVLGEEQDTVSDLRSSGRVRKGMESKPVPVIPEEERLRRRETPSTEVKDEIWYKRGKIVFVAKCAGCHPNGGNSIVGSKSLFWDDMERNGYRDFERVKQIVRYGKGKMPGYAEDCAQVQDYTQCGVISPLDEETIQDLEDFVLNRANSNWRGRG